VTKKNIVDHPSCVIVHQKIMLVVLVVVVVVVVVVDHGSSPVSLLPSDVVAVGFAPHTEGIAGSDGIEGIQPLLGFSSFSSLRLRCVCMYV